MEVRIVEQPAEKIRFRYESEARRGVPLMGASTTAAKSTYPAIEISNFEGQVLVIISCVTYDKPYRPHPHRVHSLSVDGENRARQHGVYMMDATVKGHKVIEFKDLGITFVKKADVAASLEKRKAASINPFDTNWDHMTSQKHINFHKVRLCFQVLRMVGGKGKNVLGLAVSSTILDQKAHGSLKVAQISVSTAPVSGAQFVMMFCDRVRHEHTVVMFYEEDDDKQIVWQAEVKGKDLQLHHQVGIAFLTPPYKDPMSMKSHRCFIQLHRTSDGVSSDPIPFSLVPNMHSSVIQMRRKQPRTRIASTVERRIARAQDTLDDSTAEAPIPAILDPIQPNDLTVQDNANIAPAVDDANYALENANLTTIPTFLDPRQPNDLTNQNNAVDATSYAPPLTDAGFYNNMYGQQQEPHYVYTELSATPQALYNHNPLAVHPNAQCDTFPTIFNNGPFDGQFGGSLNSPLNHPFNGPFVDAFDGLSYRGSSAQPIAQYVPYSTGNHGACSGPSGQMTVLDNIGSAALDGRALLPMAAETIAKTHPANDEQPIEDFNLSELLNANAQHVDEDQISWDLIEKCMISG